MMGLIAFLVVVSLFGANMLHNRNGDSVEVSAQSSFSQYGPARQIDQVALTDKIQQVLQTYSNLDTGVSVTDLSENTVHDYGDTAAYFAASVSKLIAASDFLSQVENGTYSLNTPIAGKSAKIQLENLIVNSDNDAWQGFIDVLGHPELERFARFNGVSFDASKNTLTPRDTTVLLKRLYQGKMLNNVHSKLLLGYMKRASSGQYLEANAPRGVTVYQKAGWLSDRLHVTGIVTRENNTYVVAIFSKVNGSYDFTIGSQLIKQIQAVLNNAYFPDS